MKSRTILSTVLPGLLALSLTHFTCQPGGSNRTGLPSTFPIRYSVGEVDSRFGITRERFLTLVGESEAAWEQPQGLELFEYDPTANFVVSLTFDERQQRSLVARKAKAELDAREHSIRSLMQEYNTASEHHTYLKNRHEAEVTSFNRRLDRYNAGAAEWNRKGGAPPEEFAKLKEEEQRLNEARRGLDNTTAEFNAAVERLNLLAGQVNVLAEQFNLDVSLFNGRFVESREFEQGQYDGKGITVYQFTEESDLRVALMHEFGHALGFGHVTSPAAIMNRRLEKQDMQNPRLTDDDLDLLKDKFGR